MGEQDKLETSNAIHLTCRQWIGVGAFALAMILFAPTLWEHFEQFDLEPDYRIPYVLSNDYWLYDRYARQAAEQYDTFVIGDSVVWGHYASRDQTLTHYLNEQAGKERFANLGLNGTHPAALEGLLEHYAGGVTGKNAVLQFNPLWLSSPQHDLQVEEEFRFNHPRLVAQAPGVIPCYREDLSTRMGIFVEQRLPFSAWTNHLQQAYFNQKDIPSWTLEHPYDNVLKSVQRGLPPSKRQAQEPPIPWTAKKIKPREFDWVDLNTSIQWRSFRRAIEILYGRGNRVFVLLGPFNEHMITKANLAEYQRLKNAAASWLHEMGVPYYAPPPLPSELYADSSHPLAAGYALLAEQLLSKLPQR
jgi:hypothetical protein